MVSIVGLSVIRDGEEIKVPCICSIDPWIYRWVDSEVLGIPSTVIPEYLHHFREENLITPEGEYEEEYILEAPSPNERVCYVNHDGGPRWLWMYDVFITKLGVRISFTTFQVSIIQWTESAPT